MIMGRMARVVIPEIPHHITQRGNRRQITFFGDDDYEAYIQFLNDSCCCYGVEILAYCLMPNHVHLIAVPREADSLARAVGDAHRKYSTRINGKRGWNGHLWQQRFFSVSLGESHLFNAIRYVELNPVRALIVNDPAAYKWSSAHFHVERSHNILLKSSTLYDQINDWRQFLSVDGNENFNTLRTHTRTGRPLGSENFIKQAETKLSRSLLPGKAGRKKK